jgi:hypothetical protein
MRHRDRLGRAADARCRGSRQRRRTHPWTQPDAWACVGSSQELTSYAVLLRTDAAPLFADGAEVTLDATVSESSIADVTVTVVDGTIILPDDWTSLVTPVPGSVAGYAARAG